MSGNVIIDKEKFFIIRNLSGYGARPIRTVAFLLTARGYDAVLLADESTGTNSGTLAGYMSRCKAAMARYLQRSVRLVFAMALEVEVYGYAITVGQ